MMENSAIIAVKLLDSFFANNVGLGDGHEKITP